MPAVEWLFNELGKVKPLAVLLYSGVPGKLKAFAGNGDIFRMDYSSKGVNGFRKM